MACFGCFAPPSTQDYNVRVVYHEPQRPRRLTRHQLTWDALATFFKGVNFNDEDGVALSVFNDRFTHLHHGNGLEDAVYALQCFSKVSPSGETRLYDSITDSVDLFRSIGTCTRPWVLIVITDGVDNASFRSAAAAGAYVRHNFTGLHNTTQNPENANYVFLVGVGLDSRGAQALRDVTGRNASDNFVALNVADFDVLQLYLLLISIRICTGVQLDVAVLNTPQGRAEFARLTETTKVRQAPLDFYFLVDCSASMSNFV